MTIIRAPWTDEQVEALKAFQAADYMHPFSCVEDHSKVDSRTGAILIKADNRLVPTRNGWMCPHCGYTQDWCHDWMLETWMGRPMVPTQDLLVVAIEFRRVWFESGLNPDDLPGDVLSAALTAVLALHKRMELAAVRNHALRKVRRLEDGER